MFLVWNVLILNIKFRQNRTIFWPNFDRESQTRDIATPKIWYFLSLTEVWKWVKYEKNPWLQSWSWFYSVHWNLGCSPTPIWASWDPKYDAQFTISQKGPMGPSLSKILEIVLPAVLKTWKICLLRHFEPSWIKLDLTLLSSFGHVQLNQGLNQSPVQD